MIRGDRIQARLTALGKSQADLAREIKVSPQAVSKIVKGGTNESAKLYQIARFLRTTPEYLTGESEVPENDLLGDSRLAFRGFEPEPDPDIVQVQHIDFAFGMGAQFMDQHGRTKTMAFSRRWLRNFTDAPPEAIYWADTIGDSMAPTISSSDAVLVDTTQQSPRGGDLIWACAWGEVGMVKRLRPRPDGTISILSDNPLVPPEIAVDGELQVLGRVVAKVGKL